MGYINRYLHEDYGEDVSVTYVDVADRSIEEYPVFAQALEEGKRLPLVLVGDEVKHPWSLSFSWVVNELKGLGVVE